VARRPAHGCCFFAENEIFVLNVLSRICWKSLGVPISVAAGPESIKHAICRQMWGSVTASFFLWSSYVWKKERQKTNYFSFNGFLMLRTYRIIEAVSVKIPWTETVPSLFMACPFIPTPI